MAMATASSRIPGYAQARNSTPPCSVWTRTMSPERRPSRAAVAGLISTQDCHITFDTGSGSSCSQGRFECVPSPKRGRGVHEQRHLAVAAQ